MVLLIVDMRQQDNFKKGCTDQLGTSRHLLNVCLRYIQIQPLEPLPACLMFALFEGISLLPALVHAD